MNSTAAGLGAAGAVLHYVTQSLRRQIEHVRRVQVKNPADFMLLDEATSSNLDLVDSAGAKKPVTLLGVLDSTKTHMGARLLRDWLLRPLTNLAGINARHDAVEFFTRDRKLLADLRDAFAEIKDIERLISRLNAGTGNGRDVRALGRSLDGLPRIKAFFVGGGLSPDPTSRGINPLPQLLSLLVENIEPLPEIAVLIDRAIVEEPPPTIKEVGHDNTRNGLRRFIGGPSARQTTQPRGT